MTDTGIIIGLTGVTFLFAYMSFQLRENENVWNQLASLVMFNLSIAFVNMTIYTLLLMVQNDANLAYLENPIMVIIVQVVMWVTLVLLVLFVLLTLLNGLQGIYEVITKNHKNAI